MAFDTAYPEPLYSLRPIPYAFGLGMVISPVRTANSRAALSLSLTADAADELACPTLESLRRSVPTARSLPLLQRLGQQQTGRVVLDYLDPLNLAVVVQP